uniref:S-formylglutathione hydrolase n=1 Tax=Diacronema lutheri TaxID=2081491 RepID=A0A6T5YCZ0_DIALT
MMPDGRSRFTSVRTGEKLYHFMGCSTFSEVTVLSEISCAKIDKDAPLAQVCLLGCGVSTGWGAVWNTCKVEAGSSVAVFGLGAVGLAVVQAAKIAGARAIYAIDTNASKFEAARALGATDCIDPSGLPDGQTATQALVAKTTWGVDFTFDCTGNTGVMRGALEAAHRGWGVSCVIGVAASGHEIATRPFQLVTGRTWKGTAFGGWKSRTHVPQLVARVQRGELSVEPFISLTLDGIEATGEAVKALHSGAILRAVVRYAPDPAPAPGGAPVPARGLRLVSSVSLHGGRQLRFVHPSAACGCEMTFSLYLPPQHASAGPGGSREPSVPIPTIVWLSGLTCTDENAVQKGGFQALAAARGMAVLYPDTSPRGVPLPGDADTWDFGQSAGFYLDASAAPWSTHYKMESYLMDELLPLATSAFGLGKCGVSGHSMGGHGALTLALRHRGVFESVSAVAPICAPTECPWGRKAFEGYLGSVDAGKAHDACCLIRAAAGAHDGARKLPLLCDFGAADKFLTEQLKPAALKEACAAANWPLTLRYHAGSDHSYFFVASVFADHVAWHAQALGTAP